VSSDHERAVSESSSFSIRINHIVSDFATKMSDRIGSRDVERTENRRILF